MPCFSFRGRSHTREKYIELMVNKYKQSRLSFGLRQTRDVEYTRCVWRAKIDKEWISQKFIMQFPTVVLIHKGIILVGFLVVEKCRAHSNDLVKCSCV